MFPFEHGAVEGQPASWAVGSQSWAWPLVHCAAHCETLTPLVRSRQQSRPAQSALDAQVSVESVAPFCGWGHDVAHWYCGVPEPA